MTDPSLSVCLTGLYLATCQWGSEKGVTHESQKRVRHGPFRCRPCSAILVPAGEFSASGRCPAGSRKTLG